MEEPKWYAQSSTWKGLAMLLGALGIKLFGGEEVSAEFIANVGAAAGVLYGLLSMFWSKN
jgi:hypothetical protein